MNIESSRVTLLVLLIVLIGIAPTSLANITDKTIVTKNQNDVAVVDNEANGRLKKCAPFYKDGIIRTLAKNITHITMTDGTQIVLKAHTELQIDMGDKYSDVISMTLFKGSLRTAPGSIDESNGHYRLHTPVGQVISTGSHFEIDIIDDAVYLSVWTGSLDFIATVGEPAVNIRLGEGQRNSQAMIDAKGQLTQLNEDDGGVIESYLSEIDERN